MESREFKLVGGPADGKTIHVKGHKAHLAIPASSGPDQTLAIYALTEDRYQFVQMMKGARDEFRIRFIGGILDGPRGAAFPAEIGPAILSARAIEGVDAIHVYEQRETEGKWAYQFTHVDTQEELDSRDAMIGFYRKPNYSIYTRTPGEHEETYIEAWHRKGTVDVLIAPLIHQIWRHAWETLGSCQKRSKGAYISFPVPKDARAFLRRMEPSGIAFSSEEKGWSMGASEKGESKKMKSLHVWLSPEDLAKAAEFLAQLEPEYPSS